jgi:hypothetical protein
MLAAVQPVTRTSECSKRPEARSPFHSGGGVWGPRGSRTRSGSVTAQPSTRAPAGQGLARRIEFDQYAHVCSGEAKEYRLELYDTSRADRDGKSVPAYRFFYRGRLVFSGADFHGSPLHAVDADATVAGLLAFLSLKPGDTDPDYFQGDTPEQLAFARTEGENLSLYVEELERR